ncbi:Thioesterase/thiol ester dehydrase-isomerase [Wallemia mellicola]|nr:Thioesterase/thiol ester dehydrase-isomerase [Wallemia mellicola]
MNEGNTKKEYIGTSLDLEKIDKYIYRSKQSLWQPVSSSIGVFGGQVISQAIQAATTVSEEKNGDKYSLHSFHCYFLLAGQASMPVIYHVHPLRLGRSYQTYHVRATQDGNNIFTLTASFALPEPTQPHFSIAPPVDVPPPNECELNEDRWQRFLDTYQAKLDKNLVEVIRARIEERRTSALALKDASKRSKFDEKGHFIASNQHSWWIKARTSPGDKPSTQKAILAYMSDLNFIHTVSHSLGLRQYFNLGMLSSIDHSMWFYDDFDTSEWLLYKTFCPRARHGRGNVNGEFWTQDGRLVALTAQQGLVREKRPEARL